MNRVVLRRAMRITAGSCASFLACLAVGLGGVDDAAALSGARPSAVAILLFAVIAVVLVSTLARRFQFEPPSARAQGTSRWLAVAASFADIEVALALVAAVYAVLTVTGGLHSDLYPLLYGLVAFSATFQTRVAALVTTAAVLALETAAWHRFGGQETATVLLHAGFVCGAAVAHALFLRGLVAAHRRAHGIRVRTEVARQRESARDYRLISVALGAESRAARTRKEEEEILQGGSVATISTAVYHSLSLLQKALQARSCVLLWLDATTSSSLKVKEIVSDCDQMTEEPRVAMAGVVNAVVRDQRVFNLAQTKPGQVGYYPRNFDAGAFVGMPVLEGAHLRGVLCVDRAQPFSANDVEVVHAAADQVMHAIRSEQVFGSVERAKYEHERFYHASSMLCQALTLEQVMSTAFEAAMAIVEYDMGCITMYDAQRKRHRVCSVYEREKAPSVVDKKLLQGLEFRDNTGLAAMVVKNKHYLPAAGTLRDAGTLVFTSKVRLRCESLLVFPLLSADEAVGTLTLASHRKNQFRKDSREMLGVITNQVAISMQNALMYKRMETMATTDGLTGLTNHRSFQERFFDLLERSERHGHKAAMLLCDVDHFKSVNDTHGHPVGDEVLRQVAHVLQEAVRKIDICARYGGEEFAVVLEATDLKGALGLAERIREDIGRLVLDSESGPFQVTMSIGVAAFPDDGKEQAVLIERADMALYHAKESGRNQVVSYQQFDAGRRSRKAS